MLRQTGADGQHVFALFARVWVGGNCFNIIILPETGDTSTPWFYMHSHTDKGRSGGGWGERETETCENAHGDRRAPATTTQTHTHTHFGSLCWACLYHSEAPVRLRLTCDRVQMDSQRSVSPFLCLLARSSLPLSPPPLQYSLALPLPGQVLHGPRGAQMDGLSPVCEEINKNNDRIQNIQKMHFSIFPYFPIKTALHEGKPPY